jgi:L-threonylcarbamoyladenylate synthase
VPSVAESPPRAPAGLAAALDALAEDGLVAFPTETVWGLACRAGSPAAVARLRRFKGRDADKPVSVLIDVPQRLDDLGAEPSDAARRLAAAFWPGPLTLVLRCRRALAPGIAGADGRVGVRCSPHPVAKALAAGAFARGLGPVTATSLNRSGDEPARSRAAALRIAAADASIPIVVTSGEAGGGEPSTVVDASGARVALVREGAIPAAEVLARAADSAVADDPVPSTCISSSSIPSSPDASSPDAETSRR